MSKSLPQNLKLPGALLHGVGACGDMFLDRKLTAAQRARVLREAVATYRRHPQVAAVFTRAELAAAPAPRGSPDNWTLIERAKASFDAERSGDFVVLLKPRVTPIFDTSRGYVSTHGSPWDYDRRGAVLFWGKGLTFFAQPPGGGKGELPPALCAGARGGAPPG